MHCKLTTIACRSALAIAGACALSAAQALTVQGSANVPAVNGTVAAADRQLGFNAGLRAADEFDAGPRATFQSASSVEQHGLVNNSSHDPNAGNTGLTALLDAVPEPGSWALLLAGLGALTTKARRQRS